MSHHSFSQSDHPSTVHASGTRQLTGRKRRAARRPHGAVRRQGQGGVERLEDRTLLSTVTWTGSGGNSSWNNPNNWSGNSVPLPHDSVVINGGTVQLDAPGASVMDLSFAAGTLTGAGALTITGTLNWGGGSMEGAGKTMIDKGGRASLGPSGSLMLHRAFENDGVTTWAGTAQTGLYLYFYDGASFVNGAGATFTSPNPNALQTGATTDTAALINFGTIRLAGGAFSTPFTYFPVHVANVAGATFEVTGGGGAGAVLSLPGGPVQSTPGADGTYAAGSYHGSVRVDAAATLALSGAQTFAADADLGGEGTVRVAGGEVEFADSPAPASMLVDGGAARFDVATSVPSLTLAAFGTVSGTGDLNVGALNWTGGTMAGPGKITVTATAALAPAGGFPLRLKGTLENDGSAAWGGSGPLYFDPGSKLINAAGATLSSPGHNAWNVGATGANPAAVIVNDGTMKLAGGSFSNAAAPEPVQLSNRGTLEVLSDVLTLPVYPGAYTSYGSLVLDGSSSTRLLNPSGATTPVNLTALAAQSPVSWDLASLTVNTGAASLNGQALPDGTMTTLDGQALHGTLNVRSVSFDHAPVVTLAAPGAPVTAFGVATPSVGNQSFGGAIGLDFNVGAQPITVTRLGVFDSGQDGLRRSITAYIYDRLTSQMVAGPLVFAAGNTGTLEGGSRFLGLPAPVRLAAGFRGSVVAEGYGDTEPVGNAYVSSLGASRETDGGSAISFPGTGRWDNAAGVYPGNVVSDPAAGAPPFYAGTFQFLPGDGGPVALTVGSPVFTTGTFTDADAGDTWTATVDYGDGTGAHPLALNSDKTFALSKTYVAAGTYSMRVAVTDDRGATGTAAQSVTIVSSDASSPVTLATASTPAGPYDFGTWSAQPVTVALTAADEAGGSGVAATYYAVDADGFVQGNAVTISADGTRFATTV